MITHLSSLLLAATAVVLSHVLLFVGTIVPRFFQVAYQLKPNEVTNFMPPLTRFATKFSWVFVLAIILTLGLSVVQLWRYPRRTTQTIVFGLCAQGATVWFAMFCYCYEGLCGPMSIHHGPQFDFGELMQFGAGIFPITLTALLTPMLGLLVWGSPQGKQRAA